MRIDTKEVIVARIWDNKGKEVGYEERGELVRCKDCKYWHPELNFCSRWGNIDDDDINPHGYCDRADRKKEGIDG